jgi:hypothetical protein
MFIANFIKQAIGILPAEEQKEEETNPKKSVSPNGRKKTKFLKRGTGSKPRKGIQSRI